MYLHRKLDLAVAFYREAQALGANADISRRKAERRVEKLDKDIPRLQSLVAQRDR